MGKWQANKNDERRASQSKREWRASPGGSNSCTNSDVHLNTLYPKVAYTPGLSGYVCDMYRGYGSNIQSVRGVRNQRQQGEQNVRQPSTRQDSFEYQHSSIHSSCCRVCTEVQQHTAVTDRVLRHCLYERVFVIVPDTTYYVNTNKKKRNSSRGGS